jgi:hypothetical protein
MKQGIRALFSRLRRRLSRHLAVLPSPAVETWRGIAAEALDEVIEQLIKDTEEEIEELNEAMRGQN